MTGRPIDGARVWLAGSGDTATTSADGAFALAAARVGSGTIEARAVGFLPARQTVDVRAEGATSVDVRLTSFSAYLDTVRVTRDRVYSTDPTGFESRSKAKVSGYFIDRERIERFAPIKTTEIFRLVPGIARPPMAGRYAVADPILMTLVTIHRVGMCEPELYVDGVLMAGLASDGPELNFLVTPDRIAGIEVYPRAGTAPREFSRTMSGCGSIVIWTRAPDPVPPRPKTP